MGLNWFTRAPTAQDRLVETLQAEILWLRQQLEKKTQHEIAVERTRIGLPERPKEIRPLTDPWYEKVRAICSRFSASGPRLLSEAQNEHDTKGTPWMEIYNRLAHGLAAQLMDQGVTTDEEVDDAVNSLSALR